jgi:hypothetical protein
MFVTANFKLSCVYQTDYVLALDAPAPLWFKVPALDEKKAAPKRRQV